jgi:hypothetical protein
VQQVKSGSTGTYRDELLQAFHMGADDLDANRSGRLGDGQVKRLQRSGLYALLLGIVMAAGVVALILLVASRPLKAVQIILLIALSGAALTIGVVMFRRGRQAAARNDVECVTGATYAQMRGRAGWYLVVGERSFRLPIRFWHVENGAPYRVYYTPTGNLVVAMEPDGWA